MPQPLHPAEKGPGIRRTGGWMGPGAGLVAVCQESNTGRPIRNIVTILTELLQLCSPYYGFV